MLLRQISPVFFSTQNVSPVTYVRNIVVILMTISILDSIFSMHRCHYATYVIRPVCDGVTFDESWVSIAFCH